MAEKKIPGLRAPRLAGVITGAFVLFAFVSSLSAQEYCLSGAVTTLFPCTNCSLQPGQTFAATFDVQPASVTCNPTLYGFSCSAYAAVTVSTGTQRWASTPGVAATEAVLSFASGTIPSGGSTTSFNMVAQGVPASAGSPASQQPFLIGFALVNYPANLLPNGSLPASLPSPDAVTSSKAILTFDGGTVNGAGYFSYTGQNCATGNNGATGFAPAITSGGIVPIYSSGGVIQTGSWISIFGSNLAAAPATWNNDFPVSLGGTSVTINNKPAYLWYVSPTQINLQVADDTATGSVPVVVTNGNGSAAATVTLGQAAPSFSLLDSQHVAGIITRLDGSGTYGGGTYDILGPTGTSLGYKTVAAKAGDAVALYGVGFGPTNPNVPAGHPFAGSAPTKDPVTVSINNLTLEPSYSGETSAGLYQLNLTIPPGLGAGDLPIRAMVGGVQTQPGVVISLDISASALQVKSISFSSVVADVVGSGSSAVGTVTLSSPALPGGVTVALSSDLSAVSVPVSVSVPGGSTTAAFTATTGTVTSSQIAIVTATYGGASVQTALTVTSATAASPFIEVIGIPTFQPAGYPSISSATFTVTPDAGNTTFTACIDGCASGSVLINGTTSNQAQTFTFNSLQSGRNVILFSGSSTGLLQLSSASMTFTLVPTQTIPTIVNGTVTGTLTVTGTPYLATGGSVTLSGPISGTYSEIRP